jgi:hypothetical protein
MHQCLVLPAGTWPISAAAQPHRGDIQGLPLQIPPISNFSPARGTMPTPTTIEELKIYVGRTLFLDPENIRTAPGARRYVLEGVNPLGGHSPHYFICVARDDTAGLYCPVSSNRKPHGSAHQGKITEKYKDGFPDFMNDSWYDLGQIWRIPHVVAFNEAITHSRNNVNRDGNLNAVAPAVAEAVFWGNIDGIADEKAATLRGEMATPAVTLASFGFTKGVVPPP